MLSGLTLGLKRVEYHWSIIMYTGSTMIDPCAPLRPTWKNGLVISCTRLTYANVNATISTERRVDGSGGRPPGPPAKFPPKPRSATSIPGKSVQREFDTRLIIKYHSSESEESLLKIMALPLTLTLRVRETASSLLFSSLFFISRKTFLVNNNPTLYCKIIYFGNRNV